MIEKLHAIALWKLGSRISLLVVTLILPFAFQKAHLDATAGDWHPELANLASVLVKPSLLMPLLPIAFLPLSWQGRLGVALFIIPVFIFSFGFFTIEYACSQYNGHCF